MALLEVTDIQKSFDATQVLKGVSFSLDAGQVLAIIGSSGSGKTTLLRCLNFLETADAGSIRVGGKELTGCTLVWSSRILICSPSIPFWRTSPWPPSC